jgi:hypothetical protein
MRYAFSSAYLNTWGKCQTRMAENQNGEILVLTGQQMQIKIAL